jgi:hypothetical protein
MIPYSVFHCPVCGAPGHVVMGKAEYSCTCRFSRLLVPTAPVKPCPFCERTDAHTHTSGPFGVT